MTSEDKPEPLSERIAPGDLSQPAGAPLQPQPAPQTVFRLGEGSPVVFNASHNQNVTINIIQVTQTLNYVHIVQQMPEFQALPEAQQERVLEKVGDLEEATKSGEPGFMKNCLKHLWDEGKDIAASVIAKLLTRGLPGGS